MMVFAISQEDVLAQLLMQLESHFFVTEEEKGIIASHIDCALAACEECFAHTDNKYFNLRGEVSFNPYNSVQYMIFLYYLSHDIYLNANVGFLCDKIYYLNKIFHAVDLFYAIDLPARFCAEHPIGSVMGRAKYNNGFCFYQGCTVGGTRNKEGGIDYPILEENVWMYANSCILGNCHIGRNVQIGAGALVKNQDVPENSIVFGQSPNLIIKANHNGK